MKRPPSRLPTALPLAPDGRVTAFSLIELLSVMAVMAIAMSLLAPAVTNLGKSNELSTKGFQVAELAQLARQNAMAKNAMTALIVATDPSLKDNGKLFTLFELPATTAGVSGTSAAWKQTGRWSNLGGGVVVSDCEDGAPALPVPLPAINYAGEAVGAYKIFVFLPDGSMLNSQASLRLVSGYYAPGAAAPILTGEKDANGGTADYCAITMLPSTGKAKIDRP